MTLTDYEFKKMEYAKNYEGILYYTRMALATTLIIGFMFIMCSMASANEHAIRTIAYEASDQSMEGQVAVASVIKTRIRDRRWGTTVYDVVYQPFQFSCWDPVTKEPTQSRELTQEELDNAKAAWEAAWYGDYNHYATIHVKPYWIKSAIKKKRIGTHIFYQL